MQCPRLLQYPLQDILLKKVNVFEGTDPMRNGGSTGDPAPSSALGDVDPADPGVDISGLFGSSNAWKQMIKQV